MTINTKPDSTSSNIVVRGPSPSITIAETTGSDNVVLQLLQDGLPLSSEGAEFRYESSTGNSYLRSGYSAGSLYLGAGSSAAAQFRLDSGGRMTLANQPAFNAYGATAWNGRGASSEAAVPFDGVTLNRGNHYNTANGIFTAPVAGYYFFAANLRLDGTGGGNYLRYGIKRNNIGNFWNTVYGHAHAIQGNNHPTDYNTLPISTVMYLNASDYVWCCCFHVSTGGSVLMSESNFSGCLLG